MWPCMRPSSLLRMHKKAHTSPVFIYMLEKAKCKTYPANSRIGDHDNWYIRNDNQWQFPAVVKCQRHRNDEAHVQPQEMAHFLRNALTYFVDVSVNAVYAIRMCHGNREEMSKRYRNESVWNIRNQKQSSPPWEIAPKWANMPHRHGTTYSVIRTAKLFPVAVSYQPMSCRIRDWKYFMRIRVICFNAAWLNRSTEKIPATSCTMAVNDISIP